MLQDVFVRAYGALRADDRAINLRAWLYRVAHNRCIDHLRRPVPPAADIFEMSRKPLHDPIEEAQRREDLAQLVADVGRLPEQQRSALLMREIDGMSYADLAGALDVTVPAVKSLLVRARIGLVEAAEARDADCAEIRVDLAGRLRPRRQGLRPRPPPHADLRRLHATTARRCAGCEPLVRRAQPGRRRPAGHGSARSCWASAARAAARPRAARRRRRRRRGGRRRRRVQGRRRRLHGGAGDRRRRRGPAPRGTRCRRRRPRRAAAKAAAPAQPARSVAAPSADRLRVRPTRAQTPPVAERTEPREGRQRRSSASRPRRRVVPPPVAAPRGRRQPPRSPSPTPPAAPRRRPRSASEPAAGHRAAAGGHRRRRRPFPPAGRAGTGTIRCPLPRIPGTGTPPTEH